MSNGYLQATVTNARELILWRASRIYWYIWRRHKKFGTYVRKVKCLLGAHGEPLVSTIRYNQLRLNIGTCRHCDAYIEINGRITTEVAYNQEIPFEGFKIERMPSTDPMSAFYKHPTPESATAITLATVPKKRETL